MPSVIIYQPSGTVIVRELLPAQIVVVSALGPQGPIGTVNPLMYTLLAQAQAAAAAAAAAVLAAVLTGFSTASAAVVTAADTVLSAIGKLQAQATAGVASLAAHLADTANPHATTKAQVGLGSVDNIASATLLARANHTGTQLVATISDFLAGVLNSVLTGLSVASSAAVAATDSVLVAIGKLQAQSTASITAATLKANLASPTFTGTVGGITKAMVGLANVDNTTDALKPLSTADIAALALKSDITTTTTKTSNTGSSAVPSGTSAQRDGSPSAGFFRYNTTLAAFEGHSGTAWGSVGGGATGAAGDTVFVENSRTVNTSYSISVNKSASMVGPLVVATGQSTTIQTNQRLVVL